MCRSTTGRTTPWIVFAASAISTPPTSACGPWTRRSIGKMVTEARAEDGIYDNPQAVDILLSLSKAFPDNSDQSVRWNAPTLAYESAYTRLQGITGLPLRDSFHLGQTIANDYGRPLPGRVQHHRRSQRQRLGRPPQPLHPHGVPARPFSHGLLPRALQSLLDQRRHPRRQQSRAGHRSRGSHRALPTPSASSRPTSPTAPSTTRSPSARAITGSDPPGAAPSSTATTPKISTPSRSIAPSRSISRSSPASPAPFATSSSSAASKATPTPMIPGSTSKK